MSKTILSVGYFFPGNLVEYVSLYSKRSLLDADVIIFRPSLSQFKVADSTYRGKPSLNETSSFNLQDYASHWRSQLHLAMQSGKNIFVILSELEEVWIDTGQREYSGTGRSRQTTRIVTEYNNYKMLPPLFKSVISGAGREIKLISSSNILSSYWNEFGKLSSYKVYFECDDYLPLLKTKSGDKIVGALVRLGVNTGQVILLPPIDDYDIDPDEHYSPEEIEWSKDEKKFGHRLLSAILEIDETFRRNITLTPAPSWINEDKFLIPKEIELQKKILAIDRKIEQLIAARSDLTNKVEQEQSLKHLLYEKGAPLEAAIIEALKIMGFSVTPFQDAESEFDTIFESIEGRFIGEAEGKDNKQINIEKLRQLEMNIQEDFQREGVIEFAKGVLFGNAYRLEHPDSRPPEFFTTKCLTAAQRSGTALVRTTDLFKIAVYLKANKDDDFAKQCRQSILSASGTIVEFPSIEQEQETDMLVEQELS